MKLVSLLLATLLLALADARPFFRNRQRSPGKLITLPVKRYDLKDISDVHPLIGLQQHINRGTRKIARMIGSAEPTRQQLAENLEKRIRSLGDADLEKRYNPFISPTPQPVGNALAASDSQALPVTPAKKPSADNSLGLDIESVDTSYLATIQIGNPRRDFSILMDSGSADFWVGSENCKSTNGDGCGDHKFVGPQSSSSFVDTKEPFEVTYGLGNVEGTIVQDDIFIAGLLLEKHTFGAASLESPEFSSAKVPFDGLMGLAQSKLSNQKTLTPVEAFVKAGLTDEAIVSYKLSRFEDNKNDGVITFGGLDKTKFDPQTLVTVSNINANGFWEAELEAVTIDKKPINFRGRTAILDTGTTLAILPAQDAEAIHNQIPGAKSDLQGGFIVPCNTTTVLSFTFGKQAFDVDPRDLVFLPVRRGDDDCISGIASGDIGGPSVWLLGATFLKNTYFSTDVTKDTLSLAKLV